MGEAVVVQNRLFDWQHSALLYGALGRDRHDLISEPSTAHDLAGLQGDAADALVRRWYREESSPE